MAELDESALTAAMALVPALYARNRFFALHAHPLVTRARSRSRLVRSIVRHLASGRATDLAFEPGDVVVVRYEVPSLHVRRRAELSLLEAACVMVLAEKAGAPGVVASREDRERVDRALSRLPDARLGS